MILGIFVSAAIVLQLHQTAFDLLNAIDDDLFLLGIFYLTIVIVAWTFIVYGIFYYLRVLSRGSSCPTGKCGAKKVSKNKKQKPNN